MKYRVKSTGQRGLFVANDKTKTCLIVNEKIEIYNNEDVEPAKAERKTVSQERKEDAISTVNMLRIENSKNNPSKRIIRLLLDEIDSDLLFIETDKTEPPAKELISFNKGGCICTKNI